MISYVTFALSTFFFFNDTATTEIYTLSLHDALPIFARPRPRPVAELLGRLAGLRLLRGADHQVGEAPRFRRRQRAAHLEQDRKSTRLNSSHSQISYAVFCLKKKKKDNTNT